MNTTATVLHTPKLLYEALWPTRYQSFPAHLASSDIAATTATARQCSPLPIIHSPSFHPFSYHFQYNYDSLPIAAFYPPPIFSHLVLVSRLHLRYSTVLASVGSRPRAGNRRAFTVQSCNKSLSTLRPSDGTGMLQIYHFVCPPQPE